MNNSQNSTSPNRSKVPDKRLVAAGLVAGAAVGAWATNKLRTLPAPPISDSRLIDWDQARSIAINMNRMATLTAPERERLDANYRQLVDECIPIVEHYVGVSLPDTNLQVYAFDRVDWVNANIDAFRDMLSPFESLQPSDPQGGGASVFFGNLNRKVVSAEVGVLLGYLARRVLGQYDIALLGREQVDSGKLYYVEPNITHVESTLQLPSDEFRMWLALHETTHVFEFEGFPWVRPHFNQMLEEYFDYLKADAQQLGKGLRNLKIFVDRVRSNSSGNGSWIESLMNEEQRALFTRMQTMMSVIEGYSNHVMNAVGRDLLPSYEAISRKFEHRLRNRSQAEQLFARLTGLDMKMEQYRLGQTFVDVIADARGHDFVVQVWSGPEFLPTATELRDPTLWISRIDAEG